MLRIVTEKQSISAQRKVPRVPWAEDIEVISPVSCRGRAVDIAPGGIGVRVPVRLKSESVVELKIFEGRLIVHGWVRWVEEEGDAFRVGIQFREEDWSIIKHVQAQWQN